MRDVKRIEVVIDKPHTAHVLAILRQLNVRGWTIFEAVSGYGDRGDREGGELTDVNINRYVLTTCRAEQVDELAKALEPVLRRFGGLCLISDAQLIRNDAAD